MNVKERIEAFKRQMLTEALDQVTEEQRKFFKQIYPKGVPEDNLISAIELCERTITKNKQKETKL